MSDHCGDNTKDVVFIHINHSIDTIDFLVSLGDYLKIKYDVVYIVEGKYAAEIQCAKLIGNKILIWLDGEDLDSMDQSGVTDENFWEFVYPDIDRMDWWGIRSKRSLSYYRSYICRSISWLDSIFDNYKPIAVIYEQYTTAPAFLLGYVGKRHKVRYVGLQQSRLKGRFEIHNDKYSFIDQVSKSYIYGDDDVFSDIVENAIFSLKTGQPSYMKEESQYIPRIRDIINWKNLKKSLAILKLRECVSYQMPSPVGVSYRFFVNKISKKINHIISRGFYNNIEPEAERYVLYPLHFHPEASTSVFAKDYDDELHIIKAIAYNLPMDTVLYVKEHTAAVGIRGTGFYRRLKNIPNIKLVSPRVDTKFLIENSLGVITLTSTVGFEAIVIGRPVVVIGRVFYEQGPGVYRIQCFSDIFNIVKHDFRDFKSSQSDIHKFVKSYIDNTSPGNVFISGAENIKNIENVVEGIFG
ncbi:hypothetical protein [Castellaniella sp.]|uniref:capsular polysaccharide export protein, LipB/KpsS family n=1 Tax=Castellaniella sp. TaxID=1955812 RepID=UPI003A8D2E67